MMSRASRILTWVGAGTVLLAAAPTAYAEEPAGAVPRQPKSVVVHEIDHLAVPHSNQAR